MSNTPIILLDVDGPLTDGYVEFYCARLSHITGSYCDPAEATSWAISDSFKVSETVKKQVDSWMQGGHIASFFRPKAGSVAFVQALRETAEIYAVTAPLLGSISWVHDRTEWLTKHYGFDPRHVIHTHAKYMVQGSVFIDDLPSNLDAWVRLNRSQRRAGRAILWGTRQNMEVKSDEYARVTNYDTCLAHIKNYLGI